MQNRNEVPVKYLRWSVLGEIVNRGSLLTIFPKNLPRSICPGHNYSSSILARFATDLFSSARKQGTFLGHSLKFSLYGLQYANLKHLYLKF